MINFGVKHFLIGIVILGLILPFLHHKKHNWVYLLIFSLFWFYLMFVFQAIIFPFAMGPGYVNTKFKPAFNFIPFDFGDFSMTRLFIRNFLGNIFITMPFGFGINLLVRMKPKTIYWLAPLVGVSMELIQLVNSLIFKSGFRVTDINDVMLNALGVFIGYLLFRLVIKVFPKVIIRYHDLFGNL